MHYFISYLLIYPDGPESGFIVLDYRGPQAVEADIEAIRNDHSRDPVVPTIQVLCVTMLPAA